MLRTDQCWPAGADDAARISTHYGMADPDQPGARTIRLETAAKYAPNRQRWLSFGWRVAE
jgi:hypothetical protein